VDEWLQRYCWRDRSTHKCDPPLGFNLDCSSWLHRQLKNCSFLIFSHTCQERVAPFLTRLTDACGNLAEKEDRYGT